MQDYYQLSSFPKGSAHCNMAEVLPLPLSLLSSSLRSPSILHLCAGSWLACQSPLALPLKDASSLPPVLDSASARQLSSSTMPLASTSLPSPGVFGAKTNEILSVMEGDYVTLNTDVTEIHENENGHILWNFGPENYLISKIRGKKHISIFDVPDGRFRDRLKLDNQTGSLTITNISTQHAGDYKLKISGAKQSSKTFSVSVYARLPVPVISSNSSQCSSSSSSSQQNCSLLCSVGNVSDVTLSWYKGNSLLSSISVSDLSISLSLPLEVEYQDKNTYSCVLNNPISNQTQHDINITQLCQPCPNSPLKVLISSAAVGFILIVAVIGIFWICRKYRRVDREGKSQICDEEITYAETTFFKRSTRKLKVKKEDSVAYVAVVMR
ncbi:SLAM family member 9-like [Garra rufa]|uniref:SLAM family member 9-like n=1 Tax=Garra rufa TaxID=137080 RepID=UPI003CCE8EBC